MMRQVFLRRQRFIPNGALRHGLGRTIKKGMEMTREKRGGDA